MVGGSATRGRLKRVNARLTLGPGGMVYLVVTAMLTGAAVYTQANLLFWAIGLMVGGLVVSAGWCLGSMRGFGVERVVPETGVVGEALVIRYRLTSRSSLPVFSLVLMETWGSGTRGWQREGPVSSRPRRLKARPMGWVLHLGPRQVALAETTCWPLLRGELVLERLRVSTSFPFGVVSRTLEFEGSAGILIYPQLYRLPRIVSLQASRSDVGTGQSTGRGGGLDEFVGVRPFRQGDRIRDVEWKRTARTGELVSREYSRVDRPKMMVMLDVWSMQGRGWRMRRFRRKRDWSGRCRWRRLWYVMAISEDFAWD